MKKQILIYITFILLNAGCQDGPRKISYGEDHCHYCKMTIVDPKFSAQAITDKGKVYRYDAIECLVNQVNEESEMEEMYVAHFSEPGKWLKADSALYVISRDIPSPMGAFLSAYRDRAEAQEVLEGREAEFFQWEGLKNRIR